MGLDFGIGSLGIEDAIQQSNAVKTKASAVLSAVESIQSALAEEPITELSLEEQIAEAVRAALEKLGLVSIGEGGEGGLLQSLRAAVYGSEDGEGGLLKVLRDTVYGGEEEEDRGLLGVLQDAVYGGMEEKDRGLIGILQDVAYGSGEDENDKGLIGALQRVVYGDPKDESSKGLVGALKAVVYGNNDDKSNRGLIGVLEQRVRGKTGTADRDLIGEMEKRVHGAKGLIKDIEAAGQRVIAAIWDLWNRLFGRGIDPGANDSSQTGDSGDT